MSNHAQFSSLIPNFTNAGSNAQEIALQEMWEVPYPELALIQSLNLETKTRKNCRGGVGGFLFMRL
jgi:hypothetical protein